MGIKVNVYAILKDYFEASFVLDNKISSIEELKNELIKLNPAASQILNRARFAVNDTLVQQEYQFNETETISIIPPSSGG